MGYSVFDTDASVFFVGGRGDKSGRTALAGGCTQGWWDSECMGGSDAQKAAAMAKLMGVNGEPVIDEAGCAFTASNKRITKAGCFADAEAGMVAYAVETPVADVNLATKRYRITAVDTGGNWVEIGDATGSDATVTVRVGGAFATLHGAFDSTDAGVRNVTIFTNLDEVLSASVDVDTGGGTVPQNSFKKVVGYKVVPGDIGRGGGLYQSALEILKAGAVDTGKCVTLDANSGSFEVLNIAVDNVVFENVQLCDTASGKQAVVFTGTPTGVIFRNCRFVDVEGVYGSRADAVVVEACYSHVRMHHFLCRGYGNLIIGCVGKMGGSLNAVYVCASGLSTTVAVHVAGCLCVGSSGCGKAPLRAVASPCSIIATGNTFYGFNGEGCQLNGGDFIIAYDNVFVVAAGACGVRCVAYVGGAGSLMEANNCWATVEGSALTFVSNDAGISEPPVMSEASMEADPEFAGAGDCDYRVRNAAVLRGGRADIAENSGQMGAVIQAYEFARRSRIMNPARMGIMR